MRQLTESENMLWIFFCSKWKAFRYTRIVCLLVVMQQWQQQQQQQFATTTKKKGSRIEELSDTLDLLASVSVRQFNCSCFSTQVAYSFQPSELWTGYKKGYVKNRIMPQGICNEMIFI